MTFREFWKDHFNILHCVTLIDEAWCEISHKTMNFVQKKLCLEAVTSRDLKGFEDGPGSPIVEHIVCLGKSRGLEVNDEDVKALVEECRAELSTEDLQELQKEQQQIVAEEISSGEEEGKGEASTARIKEMHGKWVEVQNFVEKQLTCQIN